MTHEVFVRTSLGKRRFVIDSSFFSSLSETERSNEESISLFVSSLLSLLSDSPLGPHKPPRLFSKFLTRLKEDGVKSTIIRFTGLAHQMVSRPFGQSVPSIGDWIDGFIDTPVFKEYQHFYRTGDVNVGRWLYTFLNFGKKLEFVDPTFNEIAFRDWIHNEERLATITFPDDIVSSLRLILDEVLPPFVITDFRPKFGPGAVSERKVRGRIGKIRNLSYDPLIDRVFFHSLVGIRGMDEDCGLHPALVLPEPSRWNPDSGTSSRTSLLTFVPKNIKVARSICMEPNTLMFFQQGVLGEIVRLIDRSRIGKFIRLEDQSYNKKLSQLGSRTGLIDTLDLSSASDCLSYELVKKVFPSSWQLVMRATRSPYVQIPDGSLRKLQKFAPMGSALCFPTQCIIFCAICILAACQDTFEKSDSSIPFTAWLTPQQLRWCISRFWTGTSTTVAGEYQPLGIYGDDICVDHILSDKVMSILTSLGFIVNKEKSFFGDQLFRESCGGFYLRGHDITPLYFSVKGVRKFTTPEHVASQVQLVNRCWERQYKNLYRFLRHSILTWGLKRSLNPIPHVTDPNQFGILCSSPSNSHLKKRYRTRYQRDEVRCWIIVHTEKYHDSHLLGAIDKYQYMRWWASHKSSADPTEFRFSVKTYDTGSPGLRWRWMPV